MLRSKPACKRYLFIVGCQRSGTTMLSRILEKDMNTKSYGEASKLSHLGPTRRLRLRPRNEVMHELDKDRASLIVMKPLVESQNTCELLHQFENSKAIWIYRHFKDVAASNVGRFGQSNAINDLRAIVEYEAGNWRSEKVSIDSAELVRKYYSPTMNAHDAAVLFWLIRNRMFFETNLDAHPGVMLCKYEELASSPALVMRRIYEFSGQEYPGDIIVSGTHTRSIMRGSKIVLTAGIERVASKLIERLDEYWRYKQA